MSEPTLTLADCLQPAWHVPPHVRALVTTRVGGVSQPPYGGWRDGQDVPGGLDLGLHTGDDPAHVHENRARLLALAGVPAAWLEQVHGDVIVRADEAIDLDAPVRADASVTQVPGVACLVMVADCLPVLFADEAGRAVGAAHAGWRGLVGGIVEKTAQRVAELARSRCEGVQAYLGPAIGPQAFEVGSEVRDAFMAAAEGAERAPTSAAFAPHEHEAGKYWADLYGLARLRLLRLGITRVTGGDACTVTERARFYSYRRDRVTGRMAALVWLAR
ncbi:peptidoglycan editing factor PgeF [Trinickia fusca]|uniref:Purine nucleoside phosphorylase n=1 Tax=Trinickia fusca TaxID=2419777 RepID=A0A494XXY2_9BURK|nr:peptidoglycan editing factor PgeF [Trinickia fusca]RKP52443.1 peptidoglycan editing factor PgeF [Trinickia fusca]